MTNEELVDLIQSGENIKENMGLLYQQNRNYIYKIALPYSQSCDMDDLMQEAYFGLIEAVDRFDPSQEFKFLTYAGHWIKLKISRYVHSNAHTKRMPDYLVALMSNYHKFRNDYGNTHNGEQPTDEEYMKHLEISKRRLWNLRYNIVNCSCASLDAVMTGTDNMTLADAIPDGFNLEDDVVDRIGTGQEITAIWACVEELSGRQQSIIESRYRRNMSLSEVFEQEKVSGERIRQIERKALITLKKKEQIQDIAKQWGYQCKQAYHYGLQRFKDTGTSSTEFIAMRRLSIEERQVEFEEKAKREDEELRERLRVFRESEYKNHNPKIMGCEF